MRKRPAGEAEGNSDQNAGGEEIAAFAKQPAFRTTAFGARASARGSLGSNPFGGRFSIAPLDGSRWSGHRAMQLAPE